MRDDSLANLFGIGTTVTISKPIGGRFGGLELNNVEDAGGDAHFDDNATNVLARMNLIMPTLTIAGNGLLMVMMKTMMSMMMDGALKRVIL